MDRKVVSAIIAVGIWLSVVMVFCTLLIREELIDDLRTIQSDLERGR